MFDILLVRCYYLDKNYPNGISSFDVTGSCKPSTSICGVKCPKYSRSIVSVHFSAKLSLLPGKQIRYCLILGVSCNVTWAVILADL